MSGNESMLDKNNERHQKVVLVTVTYVGKTNWVEGVLGETELWLIQENAMRFYGLELAEHERYSLQYDGTDQSDEKAVRRFEAKEVTLTLTLKKEPNKG